MTNLIDAFTERGNQQSSPVVDETFTWQNNDYSGTISGLTQDLFMDDENAAGRRQNTDRILEFRKSQFGGGNMPEVWNFITYNSKQYQLVEMTNDDNTNRMFRIRIPNLPPV